MLQFHYDDERKKLNTLKREVLYNLDLEKIPDVELYQFLTEHNYYLDDLDLSTMSDTDKKYILEEVDEFLYSRNDLSKLEKLLEYIHEKDYDLDHLLYFINYTENDIDTTALSSKEISQIADELEVSISEYEYQLELHDLEEKLSSVENKYNELEAIAYESNIDHVEIYANEEIQSLINEKNQLLIEIQTLKDNHSKIDREALIKEIQAKKYISPKELNILFPDMSISSQQTYRGRLRDKIPYNQKKKRGKITYTVSEVKEWIENQNWKHK